MQKPETRKKFQNNLKQLNLLYGVDRVVNKINNSFEMMIKEKQAL